MARVHLRRGRLVQIGAIIVLAFLAFEILIRLITPDAVQYTVQTTVNGEPGTTATGVVTDPATVARWRATITSQPHGWLLTDIYIPRWQGLACTNTYEQQEGMYRFLWHGIPVEVASLGFRCGERYELSSGGITDPRLFIADVTTMPGFPPSSPSSP